MPKKAKYVVLVWEKDLKGIERLVTLDTEKYQVSVSKRHYVCKKKKRSDSKDNTGETKSKDSFST